MAPARYPANHIRSRIWDPLARVFNAWGLDRPLWGTDWTRAYAVVNYEQAVESFLKTDRLPLSAADALWASSAFLCPADYPNNGRSTDSSIAYGAAVKTDALGRCCPPTQDTELVAFD